MHWGVTYDTGDTKARVEERIYRIFTMNGFVVVRTLQNYS